MQKSCVLPLFCRCYALIAAKSTWDLGEIEHQSTKSSANTEFPTEKTPTTTTLPSNNRLNNEWVFFCCNFQSRPKALPCCNWSLPFFPKHFFSSDSWFIRTPVQLPFFGMGCLQLNWRLNYFEFGKLRMQHRFFRCAVELRGSNTRTIHILL